MMSASTSQEWEPHSARRNYQLKKFRGYVMRNIPSVWIPHCLAAKNKQLHLSLPRALEVSDVR